jgi:hypothetical protein
MRSWRQIRPALHKRCSTISVLMFRRIGNWWSGTVDRPINSTQTGLRDLSLTEPSVLPERLPASRQANGTETSGRQKGPVQQSRCGRRGVSIPQLALDASGGTRSSRKRRTRNLQPLRRSRRPGAPRRGHSTSSHPCRAWRTPPAFGPSRLTRPPTQNDGGMFRQDPLPKLTLTYQSARCARPPLRVSSLRCGRLRGDTSRCLADF